MCRVVSESERRKVWYYALQKEEGEEKQRGAQCELGES